MMIGVENFDREANSENRAFSGMLPAVVAEQLRRTILDYLETTFALADPAFERALFDFLASDRGLFRGAFVDLRLPFRKIAEGSTLPIAIAPPFRPYAHQVRAFERLASGEGRAPQPTLVTTGTGSGKTECFLYPILDHCFRHAGEPGIKAILIYPMNALATDQARRLARILWDDPRLKDRVSAGLYVGGSGSHGSADRDHLVDQREVLRESPPDILLTNYKMLDYLLVRPTDRRLWSRNGPETLRYLVLDELHTYDGAQGADVACLIRRLKDRLRVPEGALCPVGTSATLGERTAASIQALANFASRIFEAEIDSDAVVVEDRLTVSETFLEPAVDDEFPSESDLATLDPEAFDSARAWIEKQCELWFGAGAASLEPIALGARLAQHTFLRQLLRVLDGRPRDCTSLLNELADRSPRLGERTADEREKLLDSFLSVVARARRVVDGRTEAFLGQVVQLWLRELHHLLVRVPWPGEDYAFRFHSDPLPADVDKRRWLPLAHCRECGAIGFASARLESEPTLIDDPSRIGQAWFQRHRGAVFLLPGGQNPNEFPSYLDPQTLGLGLEGSRKLERGGVAPLLPVCVGNAVSDARVPKFLARCPACENDGELSMLGSRAASLLSVAIGYLFQTDYNADKKLLAFCDSVQDASHRAGFFGARTYRFNLRIALQTVVEESGASIPLSDLGGRVIERWDREFGSARRIATFLPVDLLGLPAAQRFIEQNGEGRHDDLERDLATRMSWEAVLEYGHNARIGRSLELTACSTAVPDRVRFETATEKLHLDLEQGSILKTRSSESIRRDEVRAFLAGLIHRLRLRGGVWHELLKAYVESGGNAFLLKKAKSELMSPLGGGRLPRFLVATGSERGRSVFDAFAGPSTKRTWLRDFALRAFGLAADEPGIGELYETTVLRLTNAGILRRIDGTTTAWGIEPSSLFVTHELATARCSACSRAFAIGKTESTEFTAAACPHYRCAGKLEVEPSSAPTYYTRIYRAKRLRVIRAEEHTGLLSRSKREQLEDRFKSGSGPYAPNLFVCTPTLEMGIDVGDLSATMLCTVPPAPSNYLQRVGRAGRSTGNAAVLTLAESRPHDLYFFSEPLEMIAGEVRPPGCFLDAPEMLKRQVVAHAMDAWARDADPPPEIPNKMSAILGRGTAKTFPASFLAFYEIRHELLTTHFLGRFGDLLSTPNRARIVEFATPGAVGEAIEKAIREVSREIQDLKALQRRARDQIQATEKNPEAFEDPESERQEAQETITMAGRLVDELSNKYPLEVLTNAGVLPNYAFPEPGVELKSVVYDHRVGDKPKYEVFEYQRPASAALREMAPFNTFYAEGRHVRIDEIDLGSRAFSRIESWRFCAACAHARRELESEPLDRECPRCGDPLWPDQGQQRSLVNFRSARSFESRLSAATVDDSDDRVEERYITIDLIDVAPKNANGAWLIESLPFGIELLKDLPLREVNFERDGGGKATGGRVAGCEIGDGAFEVCRDCGRVFGPEHKPDTRERRQRHGPACRARRSGGPEQIVRVHLYREVVSEAIRILVPAVDFDVDKRRASLRAAIQLGLRRHFGGNPAHLQFRTATEPIAGSAGSRHFIVLFDAVPGGTGHLSELWRGHDGKGFLVILENALSALRACECRRSGEKDGCYRCVFAYSSQRDFASISSRTAEEMLSEVLREKGNWKHVRTLTEVSMADRFESELELRFHKAFLDRLRKDAWDVRERVMDGEVICEARPPTSAKTAGIGWRIRQQIELGEADGVGIPCRPDFLVTPLGRSDARSIAIFCDGYEYHVRPQDPRSRLHDDIAKRTAIVRSGRFQFWSVTWKDVVECEADKSPDPQCDFFSTVLPKDRVSLEQAVPSSIPASLVHHGAIEQLVAFLGQPATEDWTKIASVMSVAWIFAGKKFVAPGFSDDLEHRLVGEPGRLEIGEVPLVGTSNTVFAKFEQRGPVCVLMRCASLAVNAKKLEQTRVIVRLNDDADSRRTEGFENEWRRFLRLWNVIQFLLHVEIVSSERIEMYPEIVEVVRPERLVAQPNKRTASAAAGGPTIARILEAIHGSLWSAVEAIAEAGLPLPIGGFELPSDDHGNRATRCGPEAELAWPDHKRAVLISGQAEDARVFERLGYRVLVDPADAATVVEWLRESVSVERVEGKAQ